MPSLLLCRPDRVGDVIISTACLASIRAAQSSGDRLFFAAREEMRPLLDGHPLLDGFIPLPKTSPSEGQFSALSEAFRACRADAFVTLHPDGPAQRAARAARIPQRVGYRRSLLGDGTLTRSLPDRRARGRRHEGACAFDLLAPLGIRPPDAPLRPSVHLADSWRRSLRIRLAAAGFDRFDEDKEGYAVVNPTAFSLDQRWPAEHFAWLILQLLQPGRCARVFVVGGSVEDPSARRLHHLLGAGVGGLIDLSGQTSLGELGWLLRHARLHVSRSTGTAHLAAAVGCPTVTLFGQLTPTHGPARWHPLGDRAEIVETPVTRRRWGEGKRAFWRRGYGAIPREAVLAACLKALATRPAAGAQAD